jgi:hypothetical protein
MLKMLLAVWRYLNVQRAAQLLLFYFVELCSQTMRMKGLEPSLREELEPKSSASTNSATSAGIAINHHNKQLPEMSLVICPLSFAIIE